MSERIVCPNCSKSRKKSDAKDLQIYGDGYYCHHCHRGGKIDKQGELVPYDGKKPPLSKDILSGKMTEKTLEFFTQRGITAETVKRNKIEFDGKYIMFPYFWAGDLVNIKYRSLDKRFMQEKDREKVFYGIDNTMGEDEVVIVEGEIDVLSLQEAGYMSVISVPDGAPAPNTKNFKSKFEYLDNCIDIFVDKKRIIIAVDNDPPGMTLRKELIRRLDPVRCWVVTWPEECKDANDVLCKNGKAELINAVEDAKLVPIAGIQDADVFKAEIDNDYVNGGIGPGLSTGIRGLEGLYSIRGGQMTIVTGTPSHGKSSFLTAVLVNLAMAEDWNFALFSPENNPTSHFIERIMALYIGKPFNKGDRERMTWEEKENAQAWIAPRFKHITPTIDECFTVSDILELAKICVQRYGIKGMVVDPWNEINHERRSGLTETEHISRCLSLFRKFARIYDVHIWIVAHPTKLQKDPNGKPPIPTAYDISGSSHFYNKADNIFCVYRDVLDEQKRVQVIIQKIRFSDVGRPGTAYLKFDIPTGRYYEAQENLQKTFAGQGYVGRNIPYKEASYTG
ncbi:MAG: toprim domain-containing protein [Deltaproteobacteria bacterium]|nr:toprim domain-containing protein [Deltaproteobacteria bacterium]